MKVLIVNGSAHENGNTAAALKEMQQVFEKNGIETETFVIGNLELHGCTGCGYCGAHGECVFKNDPVNEFVKKLEAADGLVLGTPVHYGTASGAITSFTDRVFYSCRADLRMKVGAAVAVARRGGTVTAFDQLNKYFTISGMPVASGQYWNGVFGAKQGEALEDSEGLQQMRTLAENMSFLMKSIALGREKYGLPEQEKRARTNFIR